MDSQVIAAIVAVAVTGLAVVGTYVNLYKHIDDWGGSKWWFFPIATKDIPCWTLYTFTTVVAYFLVVGYMLHDSARDNPALNQSVWWVVVAFNCSAALWVSATRWTFENKIIEETLFWVRRDVWSVVVTAVLSVVWGIMVLSSNSIDHTVPGWVHIATAALMFHHVVVDAFWWGGSRWFRKYSVVTGG